MSKVYLSASEATQFQIDDNNWSIDGVRYRRIKGFSQYVISEAGRIYRTTAIGFIKVSCSGSPGWYRRLVLLGDDGCRTSRAVHVLLAMTFLRIPKGLINPEVNHKNELKNDNRLENLEWVSHAENVELSRIRKGAVPKFPQRSPLRDELGNYYDSHTSAAVAFGVSRAMISQVLLESSPTKRVKGRRLYRVLVAA